MRTIVANLCVALGVLAAVFHASAVAAQPAAPSARPVVRLGLAQAIALALGPDGNARVGISEQTVRVFEQRRRQAFAALLPNLDAAVTEQNFTRNLAAFGIRAQSPVPGFSLPEVAGPFAVFDSRLNLTQSLFDWSAIRRLQASRASLGVAELERESVRDSVASQVARAHVAATRAQARVEAVRAGVTLAGALQKLAEDQKEAGTGTGIEVTRANVQLLGERQRLLAAEADLRQALLQLARAVGLDYQSRIELVDDWDGSQAPSSPEQAVQTALQSRADLKVQTGRAESARLAYSAVRAERLPSLVGFADYGAIGGNPSDATATRTFGVSLRVPVYDGGRRDARRGEAEALMQQEEIRTGDLRRQVEVEVLIALDGIRSASEQAQVASDALQLSEAELEQARRRYQAGMTSSIEVADAQTRLERARDGRVAALSALKLAHVALAESMGTLRSVVP